MNYESHVDIEVTGHQTRSVELFNFAVDANFTNFASVVMTLYQEAVKRDKRLVKLQTLIRQLYGMGNGAMYQYGLRLYINGGSLLIWAMQLELDIAWIMDAVYEWAESSLFNSSDYRIVVELMNRL